MKKLYLAGKAVLALALVLSSSSCSTTHNGMQVTIDKDDAAPHFTEEGSVNAVLQFSSWDYTFLVRPQYLEDGYLQQVQREKLNGIFDRLQVQRGTAVVVVGWTYNGDALTQLVADWKKILGGCGFQRVVVLRAQLGNKLNGSVVVDDSILHVGSVETASRGG
jgi:type IV pilus biogenesis protein CpaD/CtpE